MPMIFGNSRIGPILIIAIPESIDHCLGKSHKMLLRTYILSTSGLLCVYIYICIYICNVIASYTCAHAYAYVDMPIKNTCAYTYTHAYTYIHIRVFV